MYITIEYKQNYSTVLSKFQVVKVANEIQKSHMKKKHPFTKTLHTHAHAIPLSSPPKLAFHLLYLDISI